MNGLAKTRRFFHELWYGWHECKYPLCCALRYSAVNFKHGTVSFQHARRGGRKNLRSSDPDSYYVVCGWVHKPGPDDEDRPYTSVALERLNNMTYLIGRLKENQLD